MSAEPGDHTKRWTEPPSGQQLEIFVAGVRGDVLARIKPKQRRSFRFNTASVLTTALIILGVGTTAGAAVATSVINSGQPLAGTATLILAVPDFEATQLVVTLTCLTEGQYTVSMPGITGAGMTVACEGKRHSSSTIEFVMDDPAVSRELTITATPGGTYTVDAEYVVRSSFDFPTNDKGQTYGSPVKNATNSPDLVFAVGADAEGLPVQGYLLRTDTQTPEEPGVRIPWLSEMRAKYPDGQPLPLYSSNGTTVLGTFLFYR
jgi:hypothetical protein